MQPGPPIVSGTGAVHLIKFCYLELVIDDGCWQRCFEQSVLYGRWRPTQQSRLAMFYRSLLVADVTRRFISRPSTLVGRSQSATRSAQWEKFVAVDVLAVTARTGQVPAASPAIDRSHSSTATGQFYRRLTSVTPRTVASGGRTTARHRFCILICPTRDARRRRCPVDINCLFRLRRSPWRRRRSYITRRRWLSVTVLLPIVGQCKIIDYTAGLVRVRLSVRLLVCFRASEGLSSIAVQFAFRIVHSNFFVLITDR